MLGANAATHHEIAARRRVGHRPVRHQPSLADEVGFDRYLQLPIDQRLFRSIAVRGDVPIEAAHLTDGRAVPALERETPRIVAAPSDEVVVDPLGGRLRRVRPLSVGCLRRGRRRPSSRIAATCRRQEFVQGAGRAQRVAAFVVDPRRGSIFVVLNSRDQQSIVERGAAAQHAQRHRGRRRERHRRFPATGGRRSFPVVVLRGHAVADRLARRVDATSTQRDVG